MRKRNRTYIAYHDRLMAWVNDESSKSGSEFSPRNVLQAYIPPSIKDAGQHFTPLETAQAVLDRLSFRINPGKKLRGLNPCAGIGHLLYPLSCARAYLAMDAYELEAECVQVGRKLLPWINWIEGIPFLYMDQIEGQYDLVTCNAPIGTKRGIEPGKAISQTRSSASEHLFLELSVRALKPGARLVFMSGEFLIAHLPGRLATWLREQTILTDRFGPLPGLPAHSIPLYAYYFKKQGAAIDESITVRPSGDQSRQRRQSRAPVRPLLRAAGATPVHVGLEAVGQHGLGQQISKEGQFELADALAVPGSMRVFQIWRSRVARFMGAGVFSPPALSVEELSNTHSPFMTLEADSPATALSIVLQAGSDAGVSFGDLIQDGNNFFEINHAGLVKLISEQGKVYNP